MGVQAVHGYTVPLLHASPKMVGLLVKIDERTEQQKHDVQFWEGFSYQTGFQGYMTQDEAETLLRSGHVSLSDREIVLLQDGQMYPLKITAYSQSTFHTYLMSTGDLERLYQGDAVHMVVLYGIKPALRINNKTIPVEDSVYAGNTSLTD